MTLGFRKEYNCCKSFGCENSGNGDLSRYIVSQRLGYQAYHCPKCGAYPPILENGPILALANQIQSTNVSAQQTWQPACRCTDKTPAWQRYGKTQTATQKLKCSRCGTFSTLLNGTKLAKSLQPILCALTNGVTPDALPGHLSLNRKLYYERIAKLASLLRFVSGLRESNRFNTRKALRFHTQSQRLRCRSGKGRNAQSSCEVWTLSTCESESGYMLFTSDNLLKTQHGLKDIPGIYVPQSPEIPAEKDIDVAQDLFAVANLTYNKIFSRSQFDELIYCEGKHASSSEGVLYRPVYAAHAHFQYLKQRLPNLPITFVLEHESFIRGAAITALSETVNRGSTKLYFCHAEKASVEQMKYADTDKCEIKILNWWGEKWVRLPVKNQHGNWLVAIALLTDRGAESPSQLREILGSRPDWNDVFWFRFQQWLPQKQRQKISHHQLVQWLEIFRYLYNYIFESRGFCSLGNPSNIDDIVTELNHAFLSTAHKPSFVKHTLSSH
ncbi:hypothetical protein [Plesiomonas shigelloides]|uniref:hypothetical protein n=1 Tax=Plesiomonas shigelloides TaxID=703 RepID=UPI001C5A9832|nr:hypothetical protein [Plesiomonas shigelloides]MBW3793348.1 hypothetical protein [Plesiomonas shigelloides]